MVRTARLIDYGTLYNSVTKQQIALNALADPEVKAQNEKQLDNLYFLKRLVDPETMAVVSGDAHLECDPRLDEQHSAIEGIPTINRVDWADKLK